MNSRGFFLSPKMGSDLLLAAAGEKVGGLSCSSLHDSCCLVLKILSLWGSYIVHKTSPFFRVLLLKKFNVHLQTGGYTTANYIWDLLQARKITPTFPAVEAYYKGLKVTLLPFTLIFLFYILIFDN